MWWDKVLRVWLSPWSPELPFSFSLPSVTSPTPTNAPPYPLLWPQTTKTRGGENSQQECGTSVFPEHNLCVFHLPSDSLGAAFQEKKQRTSQPHPSL